MIDWTRLETDHVYRADVLTVIAATPQGRAYLASIAESVESLSLIEQMQILWQVGVSEKKPESVSGVGALRALGTVLRAGASKVGPWIKGTVTPNLKAAWATLTATGGRTLVANVAIAAGAFFATDYVLSKLKGDKPEVEKLYQAGRQVLGSTVSSASTMIALIPIAIVAWGVYQFIVVSKK